EQLVILAANAEGQRQPTVDPPVVARVERETAEVLLAVDRRGLDDDLGRHDIVEDRAVLVARAARTRGAERNQPVVLVRRELAAELHVVVALAPLRLEVGVAARVLPAILA